MNPIDQFFATIAGSQVLFYYLLITGCVMLALIITFILRRLLPREYSYFISNTDDVVVRSILWPILPLTFLMILVRFVENQVYLKSKQYDDSHKNSVKN